MFNEDALSAKLNSTLIKIFTFLCIIRLRRNVSAKARSAQLNSTQLNSTQLNTTQLTQLNSAKLNSTFIYLSMHYKMRTKRFRQGQSSWYERICPVHWATHKYGHQSNHVGLGSNWPVVWQYGSHHKRPRLWRNKELGHQEEQLGQRPKKNKKSK